MTPMMKQYSEIKARHPGYLLLYRMGDFYELFNDDAVTASKVLGLTLTQRNHGGDGDTPLAGFPYHAIERYMPRLMNAGLKVAVCEQVEDPAEAKGVVKREVTEIVTLGTAMSDNYLDAKTNNYLVSLFPEVETDRCGLACLDLSTGRFVVMEGSWEQALGEVYRIGAREAVFPENLELPASLAQWRDQEKALLTVMPKGLFNLAEGTALLTRQFKVHSLEAFDCSGMTLGIRAAAAALGYVRDTKKSELNHLVRLTPSRFDQHMALDAATVRNLELIKPIHGEDETGTLFHLLDRTVTAMGGRTLKHWLTHPLLDRAAIAQRQDAIAELLDNPEALENLRRHLQAINDIERIVAKCGAGRVHARDLVGLGASLVAAGEAGKCLAELRSEIFLQGAEKLQALTARGADLLSRLTERPPLTVREGGMIRAGVYPELDELVNGIRDGREWLNGLQAREREATGINSLKVGFNKVFGYYIEVTKTNEDKVPPHYLRKQSLVGAERYITPEMKEWENRILGAESEINAQEYKIFCGIREGLNAEAARFLEAAQLLGSVDTLCCLAVAARERRFRRPEITEGSGLSIVGGRHPVVEAITEEGAYIANDVELDAQGRQILLITGPNMAGKSTYLRQAGLIVLLAQIGSFVPAESARIGLVDRIFTRVGATDRLAKGQSTFMVEMIETANILNHATPRSLVLLDEIGRGTSTYDGLSLAWAIVEALHQDARIAARTLFATHYHELTQLAARLPRLRNVQVTVKEADGQVIFLRKVIEGGCDSSYGIHVAKMAGVPEAVVDRAWEILEDLEKHGHATTVPAPGSAGNGPLDTGSQGTPALGLQGTVPETAGSPTAASRSQAAPETQGPGPSGRGVTQGLPEPGPRGAGGRRAGLQVDLFGTAAEPENPAYRKAYEEILALDVNSLTPLQLMMKISELQQKLRGTTSAAAARRATA